MVRAHLAALDSAQAERAVAEHLEDNVAVELRDVDLGGECDEQQGPSEALVALLRRVVPEDRSPQAPSHPYWAGAESAAAGGYKIISSNLNDDDRFRPHLDRQYLGLDVYVGGGPSTRAST